MPFQLLFRPYPSSIVRLDSMPMPDHFIACFHIADQPDQSSVITLRYQGARLSFDRFDSESHPLVFKHKSRRDVVFLGAPPPVTPRFQWLLGLSQATRVTPTLSPSEPTLSFQMLTSRTELALNAMQQSWLNDFIFLEG